MVKFTKTCRETSNKFREKLQRNREKKFEISGGTLENLFKSTSKLIPDCSYTLSSTFMWFQSATGKDFVLRNARAIAWLSVQINYSFTFFFERLQSSLGFPVSKFFQPGIQPALCLLLIALCLIPFSAL